MANERRQNTHSKGERVKTPPLPYNVESVSNIWDQTSGHKSLQLSILYNGTVKQKKKTNILANRGGYLNNPVLFYRSSIYRSYNKINCPIKLLYLLFCSTSYIL